MGTITFKGTSVKTIGNLPAIGSKANGFKLTKSDLSNLSLEDLAGKKVVLNIFPSIDTGICAASVRKFNSLASSLNNTVVVCISKDLPFAQSRFCGAEGLNNVITASEFRDNNFADSYGVKMVDGPLAGLMSRAVVILDEKGVVKYTEQVPEIVQEPDYDKALEALK
jgi:thioredoxin-dependent peroxiredoxin